MDDATKRKLQELVNHLRELGRRGHATAASIKGDRELIDMSFNQVTAMWEHNAESAAFYQSAGEIEKAFKGELDAQPY